MSSRRTLLALISFVAIALAAHVVTSVIAGGSRVEVVVHTHPDDVRVTGDAAAARVVVDDPRFDTVDDPGRQALPYRIVRVVLPQGYEYEDVTWRVSEPRKLADGVTPALAGPRVTSEGEVVDGAAGAVEGYEAEPVRYLGTGYLHGYAIAGFAVYPVDARDGSLALHEDITIDVATRTAEANPVTRERFREGFQERIRSRLGRIVENPEALGSYSFAELQTPRQHAGFAATEFPSVEGSPVDYVIITNDSLASTFQTLADFKTEKGVPTVVRTTEWIAANYRNGSDEQETIRNFVKDAYTKWGISYLLLGGDTGLVPARLSFSGFYDGGRMLATDMYYGCLDGDWNADHDDVFGEFAVDNADLYSEVWVSRLPAQNNAGAATLIQKVMDYENAVTPDYANRNLFLAEVLFDPDYPNKPVSLDGANLSEFIRQSAFTAPGLDNVRLYERYQLFPGSYPETKQASLDSLDAGFNHVLHIGHGFRFNMSVGDASILNGDATLLTNGTRSSNLYLLNCTAVAILFNCLAEEFMRNPAGGAVSVVGANESAFPTTSIDYMLNYYDLVLLQGVHNLGRAFAEAREERAPLAQLADNVELWTQYILTVLGDAEMPLYSNSVGSLSVSHTGSVGQGTTPITVTVQSDGSPLQNAVVCLSKGADDYQVGTTDGAGQVTLDFRAESAGVIKVVATAPDHGRHESTITVTGAGGAYVTLSGYTIDDDNFGGTVGNGDGILDAGETVDFTLSMENTGGSSSGNVTVALRTNQPGVVIQDSTSSFGVIAASATVAAADPIRVTFSNGLSDEFVVPFDVAVKNNGSETWNDELRKVVHAPVLCKVTLRVDDTANGNGNGIVDANEQFRLYYGMKNFGTGASPTANMFVFDVDGGFTILDGNDTFAPLASLAEGESDGGFELIEPDVSTPHRLALLVVDAYGRAFSDTLELRPPSAPDSMFVDPSLGSDRLRVSWAASASTDVAHYNVYRSDTQGGPYELVNPDPVPHATFVDVGLQGTTTYYYVVASIDSSGNESAMSPEGSGSTNPLQLPGWPVEMSLETVSSPVVGDIDGDGNLEVVQGDGQVHAWHHDGYELIDGDNSALTWGVLNTAGENYVSHIALARIDGRPGLDIIAASRNTQELYVFDYTGNTVAGWPQPLEHTIRAGVCAGDINGDGVLEVVAIDELGVMYVYNWDGSEYRDGDSNPGTPGVFNRFPGATFHYSTPALADIDGDGMREIIVGTEADLLYALNEDGTSVPGFPVALGGDIAGSPAVGDVDDNGDLEIVVNIRSGEVRAIHHNGTQLWSRMLTSGNFFGPSPALADMTGDGKLEAFVPSLDGSLYAFDFNGNDLPGWPVEYSAVTFTESSPIVVDIDGDAALEVILGNEDRFIYAWNENGSVVEGFPLTTLDAMRGVPTATDIDLDGDVDLIATGWDRTVYVWDFAGAWDPAKAPWAGFHANSHNDGLVDSKLPTAITGASFAFDVRDGAVDLLWGIPPEAGSQFNVSRAMVDEETTGDFVRIADDVRTGAAGELRLVDSAVEPGARYLYRIESVDDPSQSFTTIPVYVGIVRAQLGQNYPNPFNPTTTIEYLVPDGAVQPVSLVVYDVTGARVRTLVDARQRGGRYAIEWDGRNEIGQQVSSGVYFYRLAQPGFSATRKMVVLK